MLHFRIEHMPYRSRSTSTRSTPQTGDDEEVLLTAQEVAKLWGTSETAVNRDRQMGRLIGIKQGQCYVYQRAEVMRVAATRKAPPAAVQREQHEGERDGRVLAAFEDGLTLSQTVVRERVAVPIVTRLYEIWEQSRKRNHVVCLHEPKGGCDSAPQPSIGLCRFHSARSRILTAEEMLVLSREPIPTAIHCQACGTMAPRGVCSTCITAITAQVEGEGAGLKIVLRAGTRLIAIIGADRARELARQLLVKDGAEAPSAEVPNIEAIEGEEPVEGPAGTAMSEALGPTPSVDKIRSMLHEMEKRR
jgi:hypothetical protein